MSTLQNFRIIRLPELIRVIGYSRASIYNRMNSKSKFYDSKFPRPIQLSTIGRGSVGWLEQEVQTWLEGRVAASRSSQLCKKGVCGIVAY